MLGAHARDGRDEELAGRPEDGGCARRRVCADDAAGERARATVSVEYYEVAGAASLQLARDSPKTPW